MQHIEVLSGHPEPVVVVMGPRLRCTRSDKDLAEYYFAVARDLLQTPVTFRVSGMIGGPELFVEQSAPLWGHRVEIWGLAPEDTVRRCNKNDDQERDASSLVGAHAMWVWALTSELHEGSRLLDYEMVAVAKDLGVPVFLLTPDTYDYAVVEL